MKLKKHDFAEIDYTGKLEDGTVFDTTVEEAAKKASLQTENRKFSPVIICVGERHILEPLDDMILGKDAGESFSLKIDPEKAFGKKSAKLLQLVPMKVFRKEKIAPYPGLEVNVDNRYGIVRTVSGGRVIVDFNHPLSGREVNYEVKINRVVTDNLEKAKAVIRNEMNMELECSLEADTLMMKDDIPEQFLEALKKRIVLLVGEIKDVKSKGKVLPTPKEPATETSGEQEQP